MSRSMPRDRAQRPFPSMMIAMCRGRFPRRRSSSGVTVPLNKVLPSPAAYRPSWPRRPPHGRVGSDLHDLGRLLLQNVVEHGDVPVGELLGLGGQTLGLVLRDRVVVLLVLEVVVDVVPHLPHV